MTITDEARALANQLDGFVFGHMRLITQVVRVLRDLAKIVEQQDALIHRTVSKPVRDALLGASL